MATKGTSSPNYWLFLKRLNLKSLYFNFRYLPFQQAIKLPVLISNKVILKNRKAEFVIEDPVSPGMITIGYDNEVYFRKRGRCLLHVRGKVVFKGKTLIYSGFEMSVSEKGVIYFGIGFIAHRNVKIFAEKQVTFGNGSGVSWESQVMDTDHHFIYDNMDQHINPSQEVVIGDRSWVGSRCTLLKGAKVACDSIIGANSVITSDISQKSGIYVGNPPRLIKEGVRWEL